MQGFVPDSWTAGQQTSHRRSSTRSQRDHMSLLTVPSSA